MSPPGNTPQDGPEPRVETRTQAHTQNHCFSPKKTGEKMEGMFLWSAGKKAQRCAKMETAKNAAKKALAQDTGRGTEEGKSWWNDDSHPNFKKSLTTPQRASPHCSVQFSSVTQSCQTLFDSMDCMQHVRPPCPSPIPRAYSDSCPSSCWCHPTISSSVVPFSFRLKNRQIMGHKKMKHKNDLWRLKRERILVYL